MSLVADVERDLSFNTMVEVINTYFLGENLKLGGYQRGHKEICEAPERIGFWFPHMARMKGEKYRPPREGNTVNVVAEDGLSIDMYYENGKEITKDRSGLLITFAEFQGCYEYIGNFRMNEEKSTKSRFHFERVGTTFDFTPYYKGFVDNDEQTRYAKSQRDDVLRMLAESEPKNPAKRTVATEQFKRSPYIAELVKREAKGICQLCEKPAPFLDKDGEPYLESHHIVWLSQGGADSLKNTIALCPNCHKKMHMVGDEKDIRFLKAKKRRRK